MCKKAVALGNFDGMHLGHTAVLDKTIEVSSGRLVPCALLFSEHSVKILTGNAPPMLMTDTERREFIKSYGLEAEEIDFQSIRSLSPEDFVNDILAHKMNAGAVVCGYNYRFGRNAAGNAELLKKLCAKKDISCHIVGEIDCDGEAVSSTAIRTLIENGGIKKANRMLGRKFGFTSPVIHGDERGRTWGFPTANQQLPDGLVQPKFGVYASEVTVDGRTYKGVTNIGVRPTVGTDKVLSETYIIDFSGNIYGRQTDIRLIDFIRPEMKFSSFAELAAQIKADTEKVKGCEADV